MMKLLKISGLIVLSTISLFVGLIFLSGDSPGPSSYKIKNGYIYAKGIGKPGGHSGALASSKAKEAALNNARSVACEAVYKENIKTDSVTNVRSEIVGPLSIFGIGRKRIIGEVEMPKDVRAKSYYKKMKEGKDKLLKVEVELKIPIAN